MEVQYKRNYNESYMVIETEESCSDYEEQMTRQNEICCLLSFYTMEMNHRIQFWYQVTGKESLEEYLRREGISFEILDMILCSLNAACDEIKKYLLRQERICLRPETVYLCRKEGKLQMFLCYCPIEMQDLYEQFRGIMEFVLTLLEEDQQEIADACYELYDITLREHYHFSQLIECVRAKMETKTEKEEETSEIQHR